MKSNMSNKKNKFNFNTSKLRDLPLPVDNKRSYYYDTKISGLGIMVFPSGTKTFFLYKRIEGKPDKVKLGRFPEVSLEYAKREAHKALSQIAEGINPNTKKRKLRGEVTFEKLFERYIDEYAKHRKISWKGDLSNFKLHLGSICRKKLSEICQSDIERIHNKIKSNGHLYAANRVLTLICTVYNKAIDWGYDGVNPAKKVQHFQEQSRSRVLLQHEKKAFFNSLIMEPNEILKCYFYMSLCTGARRSNVQAMRWDQITTDEENKPIWRIPITKNGESHDVPLVPEAIQILNILMNLHNSEWIFPSKKSETGHIVEPKSAWRRILNRASIKDLRIHDLRRTLASNEVKNGANAFIIQKSLGHKHQQATAVYAIVTSDVTRHHMEKAVSEIFKYD